MWYNSGSGIIIPSFYYQDLGSIKRIKRRYVRYVILQIASGRLKVSALRSLDILHHDFLCTFYRRFNLLHGIPKVTLEFILRGSSTSRIRHLYYYGTAFNLQSLMYNRINTHVSDIVLWLILNPILQ
jgi:hypothetical protein